MPYNFEATFVQPLLTQLDNGLIGGSEDWANAITKAYITTIKTGLPQGTPPTLPAPGLNPTAPPPYPLGVSGFTTADIRSKQMYTLIHAYFYAKELTLDKDSINGLIQNVKQLIKKLKARTEQVKSLIEQANNIRKELAQLPQTIKEILEDLKEEIKQRFKDLKLTIDELMNMKVTMGEVDFNSMFAEELKIIDTLKNFDLTNLKGHRSLVLFLSEQGKRTNKILATVNDTDLFKKYLRDKLKVVVQEFIELAKGAVDPTAILAFISQLASDRARLEKVLAKIKKMDVFVRFLKPKLAALEKRKDQKIKEIKENVQKKIVDLQKKVQQRIDEYIKKKKSSKAMSLYNNASKTIKDYKKKYAEKAKKIKSTIKTYRDLSRDVISIYGKSLAIVDKVSNEFEVIKLEIERVRQLPKTYVGFAKQGIAQFTSSVEQATRLPQINKIAGAGLSITYKPISSVTAEDIKRDASNVAKDVKKNIEELNRYFKGIGLSKFSNLGALVMTQTKCDLNTFKAFFEKRNSNIKSLISEVISLESDIRKLIKKIQSLRNKKDKTYRKVDLNKSLTEKYSADLIKSFKDLLLFITKKTEPSISRIRKLIDKKIDKLIVYNETVIKKGVEDVRVFALNLIPLKSDVEDKKDMKARADSKERAVKHKVKQIKDLKEQLRFINKARKGGVSLFGSVVTKKNYKFSENEKHIKDILDGIYGYKKTRAKTKEEGERLSKERSKIEERFKSLLIVELLGYGLYETIKEATETDFKKELELILEETKEGYPGRMTLLKIKNLIDNPPTDPSKITEYAEYLGSGILDDVSVSTTLVNLEKKYLKKSREIIDRVLTIKELDGEEFKQVKPYRQTLITIQNSLKKNQSFIALGMKYLKKQLKAFLLFIKRQVNLFLDDVGKVLAKKLKKIEESAKRELDQLKEKTANVDAAIMSFTFGLAARSFWTGAQWTGPTGTNHIALNLGVFTPIKARSIDGASVMIREMARGFEAQLMQLQGLVIPPANTGIVPISFNGYK